VNIPKVIETKEDLYALILNAAQKFRQPCYAARLAMKGFTYLDLADDYFLEFLAGKTKVGPRRPVVNGKQTKPTLRLKLPIAKSAAFTIIRRDLLNALTKQTEEERQHVELESLEAETE
jgi:hypothetical protein